MHLSYSPEKFKEIPEGIREMETTELDFTDDNPHRDLHKREMDRRLWLNSEFLDEYSWDGLGKTEKYPGIYEEKDGGGSGQTGISDFV